MLLTRWACKNAVVAVLLLFGASLHAQWAGVLDSKRATDWTSASVGVHNGIPTNQVACTSADLNAQGFAGVTVPLPSTTTAANITSYLHACALQHPTFPGSHLDMAAGTFNLTGAVSITDSNLVWNGAGGDQTKLVFLAGAGVGCVSGNGDVCIAAPSSAFFVGNPSHTAVVTFNSGTAQGTTSLQLDNVTGLSVGQVMIIDACSTGLSGATCNSNGSVTTPPIEVDNGAAFICSSVGPCSTQGDAGTAREFMDAGAKTFTSRNQQQSVTVSSITGAGPFTVTFSPGLAMPNWGVVNNPGAWWGGSATLSYVGVTNMSMDHTASNVTNSHGVGLVNVSDVWITGTRQIKGNRASVWCYGCVRMTFANNYMYGTENAASQSYGFENDLSSALLVQNNIWQHQAAGLVTGEGIGASVYSYNYCTDNYYGVTPNWMSTGQYNHSSGIYMLLFEGNNCTGLNADDLHGSANMVTLFRDFNGGWEPGKTQQTNSVHIYANNRYYNMVGNVNGTVGYHTQYKVKPASTTDSSANGDVSLLNVGFGNNEGLHCDLNTCIVIAISAGSCTGSTVTLTLNTVSFGPFAYINGSALTTSGMTGSTTFNGAKTLTAADNNLSTISYTDTQSPTTCAAQPTCPGGFGSNACLVTSTLNNDLKVDSTLLNWGNYWACTNGAQAHCGAVAWCGNSSDTGWSTTCGSASEVPTSGVEATYPNPVPTLGDTGAGMGALPASFYSVNRQSWWNTPWGLPKYPIAGPDVTGGNGTDYQGGTMAGHVDRTPAELAWRNLPIDSTYTTNWNLTISACSGTTATMVVGAYTSGAIYATDATTSVSVGAASGTRTWSATQANLGFTSGNRVRAWITATPANWVEGTVSSYSGTTLVLNVDTVAGSGTATSWSFQFTIEQQSSAVKVTGFTGSDTVYNSPALTGSYLTTGPPTNSNNTLTYTTTGACPAVDSQVGSIAYPQVRAFNAATAFLALPATGGQHLITGDQPNP